MCRGLLDPKLGFATSGALLTHVLVRTRLDIKIRK
jgi:hypothetical protein